MSVLSCRPASATCAGCEAEPEVLTSAWVESLERTKAVSAFGEGPAPGYDGPDVVAPPLSALATPQRSARQGLAGQGGQPGVAAAAPAVTPSVLAQLSVPPEFNSARQLIRAQQGEGAPGREGEEAEQRRCLQACLKAFTRSLLRGVSVSVLLDDSRTRLAEIRLDSELTHLVLHLLHAQHPVALKCIESVCKPDGAWAPPGVADTANQALLDERCATLTISGGQCLTFVFDSVHTREYFEMCLKVIILAGDRHSSPCSRKGEDQRAEPRLALTRAQAHMSHGDADRTPTAESPLARTCS